MTLSYSIEENTQLNIFLLNLIVIFFIITFKQRLKYSVLNYCVGNSNYFFFRKIGTNI